MQAQSRFVNVGGEVKAPQRISFTPDLTILSSINAAGGFSSFADGRKVRLLRDNKLMIIDVNKIRANPSLDVPVEPGDRIEAPSIFQNSKNSQGNLQQAQQNADGASNQGDAVETQLKRAQDKLQQAQQNADRASNQRAALEAQLKETQDKLKHAQQNADLASNQRAALETQLKQAQQNADLAFDQRAALEAPLDLTSNQRAAQASSRHGLGRCSVTASCQRYFAQLIETCVLSGPDYRVWSCSRRCFFPGLRISPNQTNTVRLAEMAARRRDSRASCIR